MTRVKNAPHELVRLAAEDREYGADGVDAWSRAHSMDLNEGRWKTITPLPFPGNLPDDDGGKSEFTLRRMSFGMFKLTHMVVRPVDKKEGLLSDGITGRRRLSLFKNNEISAGGCKCIILK